MTKVLRFTAAWCGPCRTLAPIYQELAQEFADKASFYTIDVDKEEEMATQYSITSIPAIIVEKDGEVLNRVTGLKTKDQYKAIFNSL